MSQRPFVFTWQQAVFESKLPSTTKLVLSAIGYHVNPAGEETHVSINRLVDETSLSKRAVIEHVGKAADLGWLGIDRIGMAGSQWKRNSYRIEIPENIESDIAEFAAKWRPRGSGASGRNGVQEVHLDHDDEVQEIPRGVQEDHRGVQEVHQGRAGGAPNIPSINTKINTKAKYQESPMAPKGADDDLFDLPVTPGKTVAPIRERRRTTEDVYRDPDFVAFWDAYPRHDDKASAACSWLKAIKVAKVGDIIDGAKRYRRNCETELREKQYIKLGATWLNKRGWENVYTETRGAQKNGYAGMRNPYDDE